MRRREFLISAVIVGVLNKLGIKVPKKQAPGYHFIADQGRFDPLNAISTVPPSSFGALVVEVPKGGGLVEIYDGPFGDAKNSQLVVTKYCEQRELRVPVLRSGWGLGIGRGRRHLWWRVTRRAT
jgi:hypothetical protein